MALVYIDREGNYGNAERMVVFDLEKLDTKDLEALNKTLDEGTKIWAWVLGASIDGTPLTAPEYQVDKSATIFSPKAMKRLIGQVSSIMTRHLGLSTE
jgi:hypothetical protein